MSAQGGLSKRGLGSASIPKALNALGDDDSDEEDVESSPVERKVRDFERRLCDLLASEKISQFKKQ